MPTTALVTGATGFVGRALVRALSARGLAVAATSRDPARASAALPGVRAHRWDGRGALPDEALEGVGVVVHLLGESVAGGRWTEARKREILESRTESTRSVAEALARRGGGVALVSASAIGFYGDRGDEELDESKGPGEGFLTDVCVAWEAATRPAEEAGARVVHARIGLVLGKEGGALGAMLPIFKLGGGGRLGPGTQWWPWIDRDDAAALLAFLAANPEARGAFNVVGPSPATQGDFAKTLGRVLRRPAFLPAPAFALKAALGEFSVELLASRRVVPRRALDAGFAFARPELEPALRAALARG